MTSDELMVSATLASQAANAAKDQGDKWLAGERRALAARFIDRAIARERHEDTFSVLMGHPGQGGHRVNEGASPDVDDLGVVA